MNRNELYIKNYFNNDILIKFKSNTNIELLKNKISNYFKDKYDINVQIDTKDLFVHMNREPFNILQIMNDNIIKIFINTIERNITYAKANHKLCIVNDNLSIYPNFKALNNHQKLTNLSNQPYYKTIIKKKPLYSKIIR